MHKISYLFGIVLLMFLVGCGAKDDILTKEFEKVAVFDESKDEIIFESNETDVVEGVVSDINNSKRTGSWDAIGTSFILILSAEEGEEETFAYYDSGHINTGSYKVYTGFDFHKEKPWWKFW